jgi:hypothetical protein
MSNNITVEIYEPSKKREWEDFVEKSNNGTMFHLQTFLEYHTPGKFDFTSFMFRKNGKLLAVLPGGLKEQGKVFWSPVGASYGSFVTEDLPFSECLELVDAFMNYCVKNSIKEIFLIPPPIVYSKNISQHIEYAMLYRKFDFELHYISHAIDLKHGKDTFLYYDKTARKTIRKILRDNKISIKESNDYDTFNQILLKNKSKFNVKPTHTLEDMIKLAELLPDKVRLNMVYYEDTPIAGSWLFFCNSKVVLCFYNMLLYEYEHLKPVYLIMHHTVEKAIEEGYQWVDIGVSQDTAASDPMTPSISLIDFKERFFARGILRSTYHYKFSD